MFRYDFDVGAGPTRYASSAIATCKEWASGSEYIATVFMPIFLHVFITLQAISPRFAIKILENGCEE